MVLCEDGVESAGTFGRGSRGKIIKSEHHFDSKYHLREGKTHIFGSFSFVYFFNTLPNNRCSMRKDSLHVCLHTVVQMAYFSAFEGSSLGNTL